MAGERRRSVFRPCIDLHHGTVKQIVGGSLRDDKDGLGDDTDALQTNFVATHPPAHYAALYAQHGLRGGHVIKLGPGNDEAATEALRAWPRGLQVGGGITIDNAAQWLERGADKVIVTSYLFPACRFSMERLVELERLVGRERLVVDISCRRRGDEWVVAMNRWQDLTDMVLSPGTCQCLTTAALEQVSAHCRYAHRSHAANCSFMLPTSKVCAAGSTRTSCSVRIHRLRRPRRVGVDSYNLCGRRAACVSGSNARLGRHAASGQALEWARRPDVRQCTRYLRRHGRDARGARAVEPRCYRRPVTRATFSSRDTTGRRARRGDAPGGSC